MERAAGVLCVAGLALSLLPSYLHEGPDLSLAPCMVRDETLRPRGGGQVLLQSSEWNQITGPVCHLLWEKVEGGREGGGRGTEKEGGGERPLGQEKGEPASEGGCQHETTAQQPHAGGGARRMGVT